MKLLTPFKVPVILNCVGFIDRRGPRELEAARAIEQARADKALEELWRQRVSDNWKEQRRIWRQA